MKCSVGDLALVIGGPMDNRGKVVTIVRLINHSVFVGGVCAHNYGLPFWEIDRPLAYFTDDGITPQSVPYAADENLLPIRPDDTESDATPERVDFEVTA